MEISAHRIENYNFFATIFMQLPDEDFVEQLSSLELSKETRLQKGASLLQSYIDTMAKRPVTDVLHELLVDRTQLFRGVIVGGCPPPYESLFVDKVPQIIIGELTDLYNLADCKLSTDIQESREFLGVELSFMVLLCEKEYNSISKQEDATLYQELQKRLFEEHLYIWCGKYIEKMLEYARTDFYRAVALMFSDWLDREKEYFQKQKELKNENLMTNTN